MVEFYKKYIVEGKSFLVFAVLVSVLLRFFLFYAYDPQPIFAENATGGFLHLIFDSYSKNIYLLFILNFAVLAALSTLIGYASWHFSLIREKTFFPFAFSLMLFCGQPQLLLFSAPTFACLLFLAGIFHSFLTYQNPKSQGDFFLVACLFAVSALFSVQILPYACVIFLVLIYNSNFNSKNLLAFLLGLCFVFWVTFLLVLVFGQFSVFVDYLTPLNDVILLHILDFNKVEWFFSIVYLVLFVAVLMNCYLNLYKEKIKVRNLLNFLLLASFLFFLSYCLACWNLQISLLLTISTFIIPLSHYFSLNYGVPKVLFFSILAIVYLSVSFGQVFINLPQ